MKEFLHLRFEPLSGVKGADDIIEEVWSESPEGTIPNLLFISLGDVGVLPKDVNGERGGDSSCVGEWYGWNSA